MLFSKKITTTKDHHAELKSAIDSVKKEEPLYQPMPRMGGMGEGR
jgi:hypothetical protein